MPAIQTNHADELVRPATLSSYRVVWIAVLIVGLLQGLYSVGFIFRTSFIVEGQRYFCLFDDAMIAMRYAANWADGHGFVWNQGQRVEGYTTFVWVFIMGLCHLLRLSPSHTCFLVQILGIPILWGCLVATASLARACKLSPAIACGAIVLTGIFYNLIFFTLFGMETGLLVLLVTFALADTVKYISEQKGGIRPVLWFAPAALVRLDILPVMLFVFLFLWFSVKKQRLRLLIGLLVVASVISAQFLWRYHFYGSWMPNTYYLKLTGWPLPDRIVAGIKATSWMLLVFGLPALLAAVAVINDTKRWHFLVLGSFAVCVIYQIYVGGDAWPLNRFVLPASLGLFVLAADGIGTVISFCKNRLTDATRIFLLSLLTLVSVVAVNGIYWDHLLLLTRAQTTSQNWVNIKYARAVKMFADPDVEVAVTLAGVFPYFSRCRCIDLLGKCDSYIAHLPADPQIQRAGHNKHDMTYSLRKYKPDIVLHYYEKSTPEFFKEYYPVVVEVDGSSLVLCVRNDTTKFKGGRRIGWSSYNDYLGIIDHECRNFKTVLADRKNSLP